MSDEIKENSIKAYEDFKKHNIDLKLIYIDRKKIALNESTKIVKLIKEYEETQNLDILEDILNLYHTNICSCNKIGSNSLKLIDENKLFNTKYIKNLLFKTIDYIENKKDQDLLNKFLEIINKEQYKFDIITEKNKNREQKSLLHDDKIKQKIENIKITNKYTK